MTAVKAGCRLNAVAGPPATPHSHSTDALGGKQEGMFSWLIHLGAYTKLSLIHPKLVWSEQGAHYI